MFKVNNKGTRTTSIVSMYFFIGWGSLFNVLSDAGIFSCFFFSKFDPNTEMNRPFNSNVEKKLWQKKENMFKQF